MNNIGTMGYLDFPDPTKDDYSISDILELARENFGFKYSKIKSNTDAYKAYRNARQAIQRALAPYRKMPFCDEELKRGHYKRIYVEMAFNKSLYTYFYKKTHPKNEYNEKINSARDSILKSLKSGRYFSLPYDDEFRAYELILKIDILWDYFKQKVSVNEEMMRSDIKNYIELAGSPLSADTWQKYEVQAIYRLFSEPSAYYKTDKK